MKWILFCEALADFATTSGLIDRVLSERGDVWVRETLEHAPTAVREWYPDGVRSYWDLHRVDAYAQAMKLRLPRGHFGRGEPALPGAAMARNVFAIVRELSKREPIEAVVLVWDADNQVDERRDGLTQALRDDGWRFERLLAVANRSREAWVLPGFEPESERERTTLEAHREVLGYSPVEHAHRLSSKDESKRVLRDLVDADWPREERCWTTSPLDRLSARGQSSGLAEFLRNVEGALLPLVDGRKLPPR